MRAAPRISIARTMGVSRPSVLWGLQSEEENRHWLTRAKSATKEEVLDSFGRHDKLDQVKVSSEARRRDLISRQLSCEVEPWRRWNRSSGGLARA